MPLTDEQIIELKKQILKQVEHLPKEQREIAEQRIANMDSEELEGLLKQQGQKSQGSECIFCSIVKGEASSYKIEENSDAVAVLDINPISKGHALVIPKKHLASSKEIPKDIVSFAEKLAERVKKKLKAKDISISFSEPMGHALAVILPIYSNETLNSPRKKGDETELKKNQSLLEKKRKKKVEKIKKAKIEKIVEKLWLPKRIP